MIYYYFEEKAVSIPSKTEITLLAAFLFFSLVAVSSTEDLRWLAMLAGFGALVAGSFFLTDEDHAPEGLDELWVLGVPAYLIVLFSRFSPIWGRLTGLSWIIFALGAIYIAYFTLVWLVQVILGWNESENEWA